MENDVIVPEVVLSVAELPALRDPDLTISEATKAARALQHVIAQKPDPVTVNGKTYLEFEDWQTLGHFYGVHVRTKDAEAVTINGVDGARAKADVLDSRGQVIGGAEAVCLRDEDQWQMKPWFQVASMAQTRAGAKALRNVLAWVAVLAGYKPTPAEEMQGSITLRQTKVVVTPNPNTPFTGILTAYTPAIDHGKNVPKGTNKPQKLSIQVGDVTLYIGGFTLPKSLTPETVQSWVGKAVECTYEMSGQWKNLKALSLALEESRPAEEVLPPTAFMDWRTYMQDDPDRNMVYALALRRMGIGDVEALSAVDKLKFIQTCQQDMTAAGIPYEVASH